MLPLQEEAQPKFHFFLGSGSVGLGLDQTKFHPYATLWANVAGVFRIQIVPKSAPCIFLARKV